MTGLADELRVQATPRGGVALVMRRGRARQETVDHPRTPRGNKRVSDVAARLRRSAEVARGTSRRGAITDTGIHFGEPFGIGKVWVSGEAPEEFWLPSSTGARYPGLVALMAAPSRRRMSSRRLTLLMEPDRADELADVLDDACAARSVDVTFEAGTYVGNSVTLADNARERIDDGT